MTRTTFIAILIINYTVSTETCSKSVSAHWKFEINTLIYYVIFRNAFPHFRQGHYVTQIDKAVIFWFELCYRISKDCRNVRSKKKHSIDHNGNVHRVHKEIIDVL